MFLNCYHHTATDDDANSTLDFVGKNEELKKKIWLFSLSRFKFSLLKIIFKLENFQISNIEC